MSVHVEIALDLEAAQKNLEAAAKEVEAAAKAYERALDEVRKGAIESGKEDLLIQIRMVEGTMKYREGIARLRGEEPQTDDLIETLGKLRRKLEEWEAKYPES